MLTPLLVQRKVGSLHGIDSQLSHLRQNRFVKDVPVYFLLQSLIEVLLEFLIRHFVALLVLSKLIPFLLNRIVGQMNILICTPFKSEKRRGRSNVTFREPVCLENPVETGDEYKMPNVELSTFVEEGPLYIFLNYKGPEGPIAASLLGLESEVNLIQKVAHSDTIAPVTELSRFQDPHVIVT